MPACVVCRHTDIALIDRPVEKFNDFYAFYCSDPNYKYMVLENTSSPKQLVFCTYELIKVNDDVISGYAKPIGTIKAGRKTRSVKTKIKKFLEQTPKKDKDFVTFVSKL